MFEFQGSSYRDYTVQYIIGSNKIHQGIAIFELQLNWNELELFLESAARLTRHTFET